jgi:hypothetical protein
LLLVLCARSPLTAVKAQQQQLACIDGQQGNLLSSDSAVENKACIAASDAVFFYDIQAAPITANGLQAGAPTDLHLWFGSIGNSLATAFDPQNFGLAIPPAGRLVVDFGPHFLHDTVEARVPVPNQIVELGLAMGNALLGGDPCSFQQDEPDRANVVCSGWTAEFGNSTNQIVYLAGPEGLGGDRGRLIGAKFAHIHPQIGTDSGLYHNANGTCSSTVAIDATTGPGAVYCRFNTECKTDESCLPTPITATITATVVDSVGDIVHKAIRSVDFAPEPRFAVVPTNAGLFVYRELAETVDFQHVFPNALCENLVRSDELFSSGSPYAPRFSLFGPQSSDLAFPHPEAAALEYQVDSTTTGTLFNGAQVIGSVQLVQPNGAGAVLTSNNAGVIGPGPGVIGGTLFAIPVQVGSIAGLYSVRITLVDGAVAESRIVVDEATLSPSHQPSSTPSMAPSYVTSMAPSESAAPSSTPSVSAAPTVGSGGARISSIRQRTLAFLAGTLALIL